MFKIDQRVEILAKLAPLKHRKPPLHGYITAIDGSYILVRPTWCDWEVELYPNELRKADGY